MLDDFGLVGLLGLVRESSSMKRAVHKSPRGVLPSIMILIYHSASCVAGGERVQRHNALRHIWK